MQLTLTEQSTDSFTGAWAVTFKNGARLEGTAVAGVFGPGGYGIILYVQPQPTCTRLTVQTRWASPLSMYSSPPTD
jgi:hypothetical protein